MMDDSIISMMAIGITALFLSLLNSYAFVQSRLPPEALPSINLPQIQVQPGQQGSLINPGTLLSGTMVPLKEWTAQLGRDHPLIGRVWSAEHQDGVLPADVVKAAAAANLVLIGETHDNPDHHTLQAWLIRELARKGRHPAVVMEMIGADKADTLSTYLASSGANAADLGPRLNWENSGWPAWSMYRPIADAAFSLGLHILPGDAARADVGQVGKQGLRYLADPDRSRLALDGPLPASLTEALNADIKSSHCDQLPEDSIGPMTQVQRYRDATLADNLLKAADGAGGSAVLIAGDDHVRADRGVPYYIRLRAPQAKVVTIALTEVEAGVERAEDAVPRDPEGKPAVDFVWFTARSDRPDPCAELKKQMQGASSG